MALKIIGLKFPLYFSKKIAFSKDNKNNLSRTIVFIGRLSVALGIIVSLITVSTGFGSKKTIKERLADFSGHINIKSKRSNASYNSSVLDTKGLQLSKIKENEDLFNNNKDLSSEEEDSEESEDELERRIKEKSIPKRKLQTRIK